MPSATDTSTNTQYRVMVVDDDQTMRYVISRVLKRCECDVVTMPSPEEALEYLADHVVDMVFSDLRIPDSMGGKGLLDVMTREFPDTAVVLMSSELQHEARQELLANGAFEAFRKPFFEQECRDLLARYSDPMRKAG